FRAPGVAGGWGTQTVDPALRRRGTGSCHPDVGGVPARGSLAVRDPGPSAPGLAGGSAGGTAAAPPPAAHRGDGPAGLGFPGRSSLLPLRAAVGDRCLGTGLLPAGGGDVPL